MYDTVNFWIDRAMVGGDPFSIAPYLNEHTEHNNAERGYSITGKAGNYSVFITEAGISLKGSLSKYLLPYNIHTLTRAATNEAMKKLSDHLHLQLNRAKITRVDVSTNLVMKRNPSEYYHYLGNKPHFQRLQATKNTLYYNTGKKQIVFYDKIKEAKTNRQEIPVGFENTNLLRVEVRFIKRLLNQFNLPEITGATLTNEKFYTEIVKQWAAEYHSINKLKSVTIMDTNNIKTPKDGAEALFSIILQEKGQDFINNYIADLRAKKAFIYPKDYTILKNKLNGLISASTAAEQSELIKELDKAVNEIVLNCR